MKNFTYRIIAILFSALLLNSCGGGGSGGGSSASSDQAQIIATTPAIQFASTSTDIDAAFLSAFSNIIKIAFDVDSNLCGVAGTGTGADPSNASFDKTTDYLPITATYRVGANGNFVTATDQPKISGVYPPNVEVPSDDWNVKRATGASEYHGNDVFYMVYTVPSEIRATHDSVLKFTLGDSVAGTDCNINGKKTHEVNIIPTITRLQFVQPYGTSFTFGNYDTAENDGVEENDGEGYLWPVLRATGGTCGVPGYRGADTANAYNDGTKLADNQYIKLKIEYKHPGQASYSTVTNPGDRVSKLSAIYLKTNPVSVPVNDWSANATLPTHISTEFFGDGYFFRYKMPPELDDDSKRQSGNTLLRFTIQGNSITHGTTTCYFGPNKSIVYTMTK